MIFLVFYYRLSGVNAVVALVLNLLILIAFMAYRWRSSDSAWHCRRDFDYRHGRGFQRAGVRAHPRRTAQLEKRRLRRSNVGFDQAFLTIIDTHVTTIVSAIFLFLFGTGPVEGFAITLVIGLLANVFTSIYVSRAIFDWHLSRHGAPGSVEHLAGPANLSAYVV